MERQTPKKRRTVSPRNGNDLTAHQFQPGNPGGPGRPKGSRDLKTVVREALDMAVRDEIGNRLGSVTGRKIETYAEAVVAAQVVAALKGDTRAFNALADRADGKPGIDVTSGGQPLQTGFLVLPDNGSGPDAV